MIAEAFPAADQIVSRDYLDARLAALESSLRHEIHGGTSSTHRWMLTFMASQWLGIAGMITAIVLKG